MRQLHKYLFLLMGAVLLSACSHGEDIGDTAAEIPPVTSQGQTEIIGLEEETLGCNYYVEKNFDLHIARAQSYEVHGEILCGTVPHHLTAGHMAAGFLKTAAESRTETETVVIVSTLHYPAASPVITSPLSWSTPFGKLETDRDITDRFITELGASEDSSTTEYDHSSSALIPYVKYYFPEAKAACLLVGSSADKNISEDISRVLCEISSEKKCLFVFSVDFSHYLTPDETDSRDMETRNAVMSADLEKINGMTDANVDSYRCLGAFVRLCQGLDGEIRELDHSNNMLITELPYNETLYSEGLTSYFIFAGIKQD